jgi:hypothetical protein
VLEAGGVKTRVWKINLFPFWSPYVPAKTRPVRYDDALGNSGKKRAPTEKELNWFLEYVHNKSG